MKRKIYFGLGAIVLMVLGFTLNKDAVVVMFRILSFPFSLVASCLRSLSQSGSVGNVFSILLYSLVCLIPMIIGFLFRKRLNIIDKVILPVLSLILFITVYMYINPFLLKDMYVYIAQVGWEDLTDFILLSGFSNLFYMSLGLYGMLKVFKSKKEHTLRTFSMFVNFIVLILFFSIFFVVPSNLISYRGDKTLFYQHLKYILEHISFGIRCGLYLYALILFKVICINSSEFSQTLVTTTKRFQKVSRVTIIYLISSVLFFNIYQIVFASSLNHISFVIDIPLFELLVFFLSLFLTHSFIKSYELSEESKLTI